MNEMENRLRVNLSSKKKSRTNWLKYYQTGYKGMASYVDFVKCLLAWFEFIKIWVKKKLKNNFRL